MAFLGENTLLGSLYEAADGVPSDQGAAALGCLDLQTGEWQKLISPPDGATDVILTFSDSYIVYWEIPFLTRKPPPQEKPPCAFMTAGQKKRTPSSSIRKNF